MKMKDITGLVERHLIPVAKIIVESDQQHAPIFFIGKDNALVPVLLSMKNEREKDVAAFVMESTCKRVGADFSILITECWYLRRPDGVNLEDVIPSESPDKKEAVSFTINKRNGENASLMLPFKRVKGKVEFGKLEKCSQSLGGRFVFTW